MKNIIFFFLLYLFIQSSHEFDIHNRLLLQFSLSLLIVSNLNKTRNKHSSLQSLLNIYILLKKNWQKKFWTRTSIRKKKNLKANNCLLSKMLYTQITLSCIFSSVYVNSYEKMALIVTRVSQSHDFQFINCKKKIYFCHMFHSLNFLKGKCRKLIEKNCYTHKKVSLRKIKMY